MNQLIDDSNNVAIGDGKDFRRCDFRVGKIMGCKNHETSDRLLVSKIDIGFWDHFGYKVPR